MAKRADTVDDISDDDYTLYDDAKYAPTKRADTVDDISDDDYTLYDDAKYVPT